MCIAFIFSLDEKYKMSIICYIQTKSSGSPYHGSLRTVTEFDVDEMRQDSVGDNRLVTIRAPCPRTCRTSLFSPHNNASMIIIRLLVVCAC